MKSILTLTLSLFALAAFAQNKVCAVMSPISQFPGQPVGDLKLEAGTTIPATVLAPPNTGGCLDLTGQPIANGTLLRPYKNINPMNGVSTFDMVKISQAILGTTTLSCYQKIAADINNNGAISTFDLVELRKIILGIYTGFPNNTSWRFVPKNCASGCTGCPTCTFGASTNMDCEFFGIKVGDLSGDAIPNNFSGEVPEVRSPTLFYLENRPLKGGQTVEIPVFLEKENALLAWQLALNFNPDFINIKETLPEGSDGSEAIPMVARTAPGRVAMNWFSATPRPFLAGRDALISLKINVLRDCKLADALFLENENLAPEVFFGDETSQPVALVFSEKKEAATASNLTAWPNPFSEKTTLEWSQAQPGEAAIDVFDATGRAIFSTKVWGEEGANRFALDGFSEGLFFVKIQSSREIFTTTVYQKN